MKRLSMSAESMRAILAGKKDLTSRVVVPQPEQCGDALLDGKRAAITDWLIAHVPYHVGERVALTEGFYVQTDMGWPLTQPQPIEYAANVPDRRQVEDYHYVPAFLMPCWASRQIVVITSVDAGRLWDMTYEDFVREGWDARSSQPMTDRTAGEDARAWYMALWDSLNAKRGYPSSMNPWTYHYGLRRD